MAPWITVPFRSTMSGVAGFAAGRLLSEPRRGPKRQLQQSPRVAGEATFRNVLYKGGV